jgi:hypothetical protein
MDWCRERNILYDLKKEELHGSFMLLGEIKKYSPKFNQCLHYLLTKPGKSFIYFNQVRTYGVLFICQMLRENGLLEHDEAVRKDSICFKCKQKAESHSEDSHSFQPFRFFKITGEEGT